MTKKDQKTKKEQKNTSKDEQKIVHIYDRESLKNLLMAASFSYEQNDGLQKTHAKLLKEKKNLVSH